MIGIIGHTGVVGGAIYNAFENAIGVSLENLEDYPKLKDCEVIFVCVPTPSKSDGTVDMKYVYDAMKSTPPNNQIMVMKSTVLPGTNEKLSTSYPQFRHVSSPEFLTEHNAKEDFLNPDRVIIGASNSDVGNKVINVYSKRLGVGIEYVVCRPIEAELAKYMANAFLAMKVIYANEGKRIAELHGADWKRIAVSMGLDSRIGSTHLDVTEKGGYGGMCFPKDVEGILRHCEKKGYTPRLIKDTHELNEEIRNSV